MTFDQEIDSLIQRYLIDDGVEITLEEIAAHPKWERVILYWLALEKYEGKEFNRERLTLDEVKAIYGK